MSKPAKVVALAFALVAALALALVGPISAGISAAQPFAQARPVRVITGMGIIKDLVEQVGGSRVEVVSVVPPGADPHTYQPTPRDIQSMQIGRASCRERV